MPPSESTTAPEPGTARGEPNGLLRELTDSTRLMKRIADNAVTLVPGATFAGILRPDGDDLVLVAASRQESDMFGYRCPMDATLSGLALRRGEALVSECPARDPRVDPAVRAHPRAGSLLAMPLQHDGRALGVLVLVSTEPGAFTAHHCVRVDAVAEFITTALRSMVELADQARDMLSAPRADHGLDDDGLAQVTAFMSEVVAPGQADRLRERGRVQSVIAEESFSIVVQPIVDLGSGRTRCVEALSRFSAEPRRGPDEWFAAADAADLGLELEQRTLARALCVGRELPTGTGLAVNVSPGMLISERLSELLAGAPAAPLTLELTEHERCRNYARIRDAIAELRGRGVRVSIDDVGAGYSSLRHVVELGPDEIKLDRYFMAGIEGDRTRAAMADSLVSFARAMGIELVAEGIETEPQMRAIRGLGIRWGQGYLIARPGPVADVATRYDALAG